RVGLVGRRRDLPDPLERDVAALGEADRRPLGDREGAAEVVAPGEARPPVRRGRGGPEAPPAVARVERGDVDLLAGQVGTAPLPALAGPIAGVEEQPLRGADDDERAVAARDVARFRHAGKCSMAAPMRRSLFVVALLAAPARADQPLDYIEKIFGAT